MILTRLFVSAVFFFQAFSPAFASDPEDPQEVEIISIRNPQVQDQEYTSYKERVLALRSQLVTLEDGLDKMDVNEDLDSYLDQVNLIKAARSAFEEALHAYHECVKNIIHTKRVPIVIRETILLHQMSTFFTFLKSAPHKPMAVILRTFRSEVLGEPRPFLIFTPGDNELDQVQRLLVKARVNALKEIWNKRAVDAEKRGEIFEKPGRRDRPKL